MSRARRSLALRVLCLAPFLLAQRGEPALETLEIVPGVFARGRSLGPDRVGVEAVWIRPARVAGQPSPDLGPLLEAAFDWCAGNSPNGFRNMETGFDSRHGCPIRLESGPYRLARTAVLRERRGQTPIEVDLGSATIMHIPETPRSVRVAEIPSLPCDPGHQGDYFNVSDPESLDDFRHADPDGDVPIERIVPNDQPTRHCLKADSTCEYGGNAALVTTSRPHGLSDGGELGLGDIAVFHLPGTPWDGERLLVKEIVSPTAFIVTPVFPPPPATGGSVRETETTIWCNGHRWRAGKPMIAIGGPDDARDGGIRLHGGRFAVDGNLYRTAAVLIDGDSGPQGRGGAEWIQVQTTNVGNGSLRGQIVVDMGTDDPASSLCQNVDVRVLSDSWGSSWGPAVWDRTCALATLDVRTGHGGGAWIGVDAPGYNGPGAVALSGALQGCKDGPCLWIRSGIVQTGPGFLVAGAQFGPMHAPPGPWRGLLAVFGGAAGARVQLIAHGTAWTAGQESDLDCYVVLGNVASFLQVGGLLTGGNADQGSGKERLFCSAKGTRAEVFRLEDAAEMRWGGDQKLVDVERVSSGSR